MEQRGTNLYVARVVLGQQLSYYVFSAYGVTDDALTPTAVAGGLIDIMRTDSEVKPPYLITSMITVNPHSKDEFDKTLATREKLKRLGNRDKECLRNILINNVNRGDGPVFFDGQRII
jgi:hypothetical protein